MLATLIAAALQASAPSPAAAPTLRQGLEPLAFLVGHCWRGTFADGRQDTHCFESVYAGQHVRDRHEVTGGASVYRGETLYSWDAAANAVSYTYWNSLGGVSRGSMRPGEGRLDFGTESHRAADGRTLTIATHWRLGAGAYEAVSVSRDLPSMNRTVRYVRVEAPPAAD